MLCFRSTVPECKTYHKVYHLCRYTSSTHVCNDEQQSKQGAPQFVVQAAFDVKHRFVWLTYSISRRQSLTVAVVLLFKL